jgi:hypothetical protein
MFWLLVEFGDSGTARGLAGFLDDGQLSFMCAMPWQLWYLILFQFVFLLSPVFGLCGLKLDVWRFLTPLYRWCRPTLAFIFAVVDTFP